MTQRGRSIFLHEGLNKRVSNRLSDEFIYRQSLERHIGKRTGNLYRRLHYKENFDGFPRFSEYQSHHRAQLSSLAKSFQFDSMLKKPCQKNRQINQWRQEWMGQQMKNAISRGTKEEKVKTSDKSVLRKDIFGIEQFFSTIKKEKGTTQLRASQVKQYKKLINQMENNSHQQFQFNQQGVKLVASAASLNKSPEQTQSFNKKKKRVSFKFNQNLIFREEGFVFQEQQVRKQQRQSLKPEMSWQGNELENIGRIEETGYLIQIVPLIQNEIRSEKNDSSNQKRNLEWENRKDKKEKKIKQISNKTQIQEKQRNRKNWKRSIRRKQIKQNQDQVDIKCGSKYCIINQQKQYLKQLYWEHSEKNQNERYPKRTRMKPMQYWQNQKVQYKKGKAVRIQQSTLNMKQLISTNQTYPNKININFSTHNIEIYVRIPAKKQLRSAGICDLYQRLELSLTNKIQHSQVYYYDDIRKQQLVYEQHTAVPIFTSFIISNCSRRTVDVHIKMIVKSI